MVIVHTIHAHSAVLTFRSSLVESTVVYINFTTLPRIAFRTNARFPIVYNRASSVMLTLQLAFIAAGIPGGGTVFPGPFRRTSAPKIVQHVRTLAAIMARRKCHAFVRFLLTLVALVTCCAHASVRGYLVDAYTAV